MTSLILSGMRLNGSVVSDNRWDLIVLLSIDMFDVGNNTGSSINVYSSGSSQAHGWKK